MSGIRKLAIWGIVLSGAFALAACGNGDDTDEATEVETVGAAAVDSERIIQADREPGNWMTTGRTYQEQRYSPLTQIDTGNVNRLGLAWYLDLETSRGQEATPIVVDGVMYVSTAWSIVKALDAATGEVIWSYDPQVPREWLAKACCGPVNRGVAVWKGKVYVATLDGRLLALDAGTGELVWETLTIDKSEPYAITGAPRVVKGKVIIGNGGAEFAVRGYVSAYDAETGEMVWRFYTVPGDPSTPPDNPIHEMTAKTWNGEWWKLGGGGTVWDSMAYDPELDLLYIGVGNGSPWNQSVRSPGGGDNLFLSSIVALDPDTGEYVWHYQTTPGDAWDYTATQHMILADLKIDGEKRKVIMQAPKNGFFYVLDRETGEFISAEPYVDVNWAMGIDPETGRPNVNPDAHYGKTGEPWGGLPGAAGGHSWQPMSYHPGTGLVYFPIQDIGFGFVPDKNFKWAPIGLNVGVDMAATSLPTEPEKRKPLLDSLRGRLAAWDPVAQKLVWDIPFSSPWNSGIVSTAGNLVFQGNANAEFAAYRVEDGEKLWSAPTQTGVLAAPVTYLAGGEQYVAVLAGWGGGFPLAAGEAASEVSPGHRNISRLLAYKLGGDKTLPAPPPPVEQTLNPPPLEADEATIAEGKALYHRYCVSCHGDGAASGGLVPDLRYSTTLGEDVWFDVVLDGLLAPNGMASFGEAIDHDGAAAIRAYVIKRAHETKALKERAETARE